MSGMSDMFDMVKPVYVLVTKDGKIQYKTWKGRDTKGLTYSTYARYSRRHDLRARSNYRKKKIYTGAVSSPWWSSSTS